MSLREYDETILKEDDEYETPNVLFHWLCMKFKVRPILDVCATKENTKCDTYLSKRENALMRNWLMDSWCNPPHSLTEQFVLRANQQWMKYDIDILMIVPANAIGAHFFDDIFEKGYAKYYRISGRPRFLQHGKPAPNSSRNGYFVVVWKRLKV